MKTGGRKGMKKRRKEQKDTQEVFVSDIEIKRAICVKVAAEGFVPKEVLVGEFGAEQVTMALAVLYRNLRVFREAWQPWKDGKTVLGYAWADVRFSKSHLKSLPPGYDFLVELTQKPANRYGDFVEVNLRCRWTNWVRGGLPSSDNGNETRVFERDGSENVLIPAYCARAMLQKALPLIGREASIGRHVRFKAMRITNPPIKIRPFPVPPDDFGKQTGKGIEQCECMPPGTEFVLEALVPTTALSVGDYLRALNVAGERVRLSPGRSAGYGDFEVLGEA